jgi:hypothetical protein
LKLDVPPPPAPTVRHGTVSTVPKNSGAQRHLSAALSPSRPRFPFSIFTFPSFLIENESDD